MPSKEFTFGFVLSAAMNSSFASSFAKASREVDELRKYMDKLGEETQQLQKLSERESLMRKHSIPQLCKRIRKAFLHGKMPPWICSAPLSQTGISCTTMYRLLPEHLESRCRPPYSLNPPWQTCARWWTSTHQSSSSR